MTKAERLQRVFHQYEEAHGHTPAPTRNVVRWAVDNRLLALPTIDPEDLLAEQMARSLREERRPDPQGRLYRVNHAATITKDGVQLTMWGNMEFAPRAHMEMSFTQRREQIVGDCHQLKVDVDAFNAIKLNGDQYELILDFTDDVAERDLSQKMW